MSSTKFYAIFLLLGLIICTGKTVYSQTTSSDVIHQQRILQGLESPTRIAVDNSDNMYVTDHYQKSIVKYDAAGTYLETISTGFAPLSIAVNDAGQIFVGTEYDGRIYKIETNGSMSTFYTGCIMPSSMTFSPSGLLYVVDSEEKQVISLDVSANVVLTFGLGDLIYPTSIAYDTRNSRILVGEHGGIGTGFNPPCKVWIYDFSGNLLGSFGSNGNVNGKFYRIQGLAIGKCGNIYVNEPFQGNISVFDENLNFLTKFGYFGEALGELNVPLDIIFDSQERILLTSMNNSSVEIFTVSDTLPTSNISNSDATICNGSTSDIQIDFTGTPPWDFTYSIDGVNQSPISTSNNPYILTVSTAGLYQISALSDATTSGTCFTGSALIAVSATSPTADITTGNISICDNEIANIPIDFTGTPPWTFTYTIDGQNPTTIITANNPYELNTNTPGMYEVNSITDAGCIGIGSGYADLTVVPVPSSTISSNDLDLCQGETTILSVDFTGTSPWTFTYSYNGQDSIITTNNSSYDILTSDAGIYAVSTVSDISCTNTQNQSEVEVVVNPLPTAIMDNVTSVICDGDLSTIPIQLTGTFPWTLTYAIDSLTTTTLTNIYSNPFNLYVGQGGTYTITEISDANCIGTVFSGSSDIIVLPVSVPDFTFIQNGLEVSFTNNSLNSSSYLWEFGDGNTSTIIHPVHIYQTGGIYQVNLTATNTQCGDNVFGQTVDLLVGVEDINQEDLVKFYPNPSNGLITMEISLATKSDIYVEITSVNGQTIYSNQYKNTGKLVEQIDLSRYSSGLYTVKIISDELTKTAKLVLYK